MNAARARLGVERASRLPDLKVGVSVGREGPGTARDRVTFEVPASTWQMWKKRHAQRWYARRLVARWPVRYEPDPEGRGMDAVCTFNLERWRSYPRAQVQLPRDRFGDAVRVHAVRDLRWDLTGGETP